MAVIRRGLAVLEKRLDFSYELRDKNKKGIDAASLSRLFRWRRCNVFGFATEGTFPPFFFLSFVSCSLPFVSRSLRYPVFLTC